MASSFSVKPYESNLRGGYNTSNLSSSNKSQAPVQARQVSGKLKIDKSTASSQQNSSDTRVASDRQRVENKIGNLLLTSATQLTVRSSLNQSFSDGVSKLKTLAKSIKTEVDPTRKEDLIAEANSVLTSLQSQYDSAVADDPNLSKDINITALVKPGDQTTDSSKYKKVSISGATSPNASGLSGIDFSDPDTAIEKIDISLATYSQKQNSYNATSTEIAGATSKALSQLSAGDDVKKIDDAEKKAQDLANQITDSSEKLLSQNKIDNTAVKDLLESKKEDDNSESENKEDTNKKSDSASAQKISQYSNSYQNGGADSASFDIAA